MFGIAGVSLVAWFLSVRTWFLAGSILKRLRLINNGGLSNTSREHRSLQHTTCLPDSFAIKAQTVRLGGGLWLVGTLASVLPLLGLLGTVLGMLLSFEVIQIYGTSQPRLLAGGIGQALITTQAGLWMAVPVFFFHHIISRRIRLIRNQTDVLFHIMQTSTAGRLTDEQHGREGNDV